MRSPFVQAPRHALQVFAGLQLHGQHVGRAAGQDGQRHLGVHHALGHFVDGAVAAGRHHQVRATRNVFTRDGSRHPGARSRRHNDVVAFFP